MKVYVVHTTSTPIGDGVVWAVCKTKAKAEEIAKEHECADVEEFYLLGGKEYIPVACVLRLITHHFDHDDQKFKDECYKVAQDLYEAEKEGLSDYIMAQLSDGASFVPMGVK